MYLNMSVGKLCAQIGHGIESLCNMYSYYVSLSERLPTDEYNLLLEDYWSWVFTSSSTKIVLGANSKEFNKLKKSISQHFVVTDAGKTELKPGTETVLCFWPIEKDSDKMIKRLRLL